jgi:hypothetical protein
MVFADLATVSRSGTPPPVVTVEVSPESVPENDKYKILFKFARTGDVSKPLIIYYTLDGTATPKTDYRFPEILDTIQKIEIPSGQSSVNLEIIPIPDIKPEGNETVIVDLVPDDSYNRGTFDGVTGTIREDVAAIIPFNYMSIAPIAAFSTPLLSFLWDTNFYNNEPSEKNAQLSKVNPSFSDSNVNEVPAPLSILSVLGLLKFKKTIKKKYKL